VCLWGLCVVFVCVVFDIRLCLVCVCVCAVCVCGECVFVYGFCCVRGCDACACVGVDMLRVVVWCVCGVFC